MTSSFGPWFDYTINGLVVGNIYALLAVGLALIYGVSHLINFAHGSVYMAGAYIGWLCITYLGTPLPVTLAVVLVGSGAIGLAIERIGLRPLQGSPRIAPLLATIGIGLVLDQVAQLLFTPDPRGLPLQLPAWRIEIGGGTIGVLDILIAGIGLASGALLYVFLRFTKLGWAVRATALDRDAAQQCGVDVNRVNSAVFAIAAALGGVSGFLVGMYYNSIDPYMGFQAGLKGIIATMIGGMGNVPGAIAGSLLLGLTESYGIAAFGTSYRNLFAFVVMILILVLKPNGIFSRGRSLPPEPLTGTFIAPSAPLRVPMWLVVTLAVAALALPLVVRNGYVLQTLGIGWLYAVMAISLTLVAGTAGMISLGHAGLLAIGAYASALLAINFHLPVSLTVVAAGVITALLGTLIIFPSFRLRGHYVTIATLGVGEIVTLTILNWDSLTRGPVGLTAIPPLSAFGKPLLSGMWVYEIGLCALIVLALVQWRLLGSHLGRTMRAIRDDDVAARSYGIALDRYKSLAFGVAGFAAGIAGALMAHIFSYVNHETFTSQASLLALTMVILGGLGNITGAIIGAIALVSLPELFRFAADYRLLIYGIALLLLIRFRPQGLLGDSVMAALLDIAQLTRRFGGVTAVNALSLSVSEGELVSVIGPNGAGKTTVFNLVTGLDTPDAGTVTFDGRNITGVPAEKLAQLGFARTFQHGRVFGNLTVLDNVLVGAHTRLSAVRPAWPVIGAVAELALALVRPDSVKAEEAKLRADAMNILALFGERLTPRINNPAFSLSYANRRRLEIARALSLKPRVLFLDEPTAGMNPTETAEMLEIIRGLKGKFTILLIEHKLDLVMQLSDRVVVMDDGRKIAEGAARDVAADPAVITAYLGSREVGGAREAAQ